MAVSKELIKEFAKITYDSPKTKTDTTAFGIAHFAGGESYVMLDGSDIYTPAVYSTEAHEGDRVLCVIKGRKVYVTNNITTPSLTLGILKATTGIIVQGYLTTNENRIAYNDRSNAGVTFSSNGIGGYGGNGKYWEIDKNGKLTANDAEIVGNVTASSGYLGSAALGFIIDDAGIYSGNRGGTANGDIVLSTTNVSKSIGGYSLTNVRFSLGGKFAVTSDGALYASDAVVVGSVTASSGYLGSAANGFNIDEYGIYSGARNDPNSKTGTGSGYITLSTQNFQRTIGTTPRTGLRFAIGGNFAVSETGVLYAESGVFGGEIKASSGNVGIFIINNALYTNNKTTIDSANSGVYLGSDGISLGQNAKFKVTSAGILTATEATIGGTLTAGEGSTIGPWYIGRDAILSSSSAEYGVSGIFIGTTGISLSSNFKVSSAGALEASNATLSGTLTAGAGSKIGPWTVSSTAIHKNATTFKASTGIHIGEGGISLTDKFWVSSSGEMKATSGTIGPLTIGASALYTNDRSSWNASGDGIYIGSDRLTFGSGGKFQATNAGNVYLNGGVLTINSTSTSILSNATINFTVGETQYAQLSSYIGPSTTPVFSIVGYNSSLIRVEGNNVEIHGGSGLSLSSTGSVQITGSSVLINGTNANSLGAHFLFETLTSSATPVSETSAANIDVSIPSHSGYVWVGYRAVSCGDNKICICGFNTVGSGSKFRVRVYNPTSSTVSVTVTIRAIYVTSGFTSGS